MTAIIATFVSVLLIIPVIILSFISEAIIHITSAFTGTEYVDCFAIEMRHCYERGGEFYIPDSTIKSAESYDEVLVRND